MTGKMRVNVNTVSVINSGNSWELFTLLHVVWINRNTNNSSSSGGGNITVKCFYTISSPNSGCWELFALFHLDRH